MTEGMVTIMAVFAQIEKSDCEKAKGGSGRNPARGATDRRSEGLSESSPNSCGRPSDSSMAIERAAIASRYFGQTEAARLRHQKGHAILGCPGQTLFRLIGSISLLRIASLGLRSRQCGLAEIRP